MKGFALEAVDTWFFRDGRPFSPQSATQGAVGGLFPPPPPTVVGALRATLARCNGWGGKGSWEQGLIPVLGDGPDNLGAIELFGPLLLLDDEPLFPMPRHVLGIERAGKWRPKAYAAPGTPVHTDLGDARLPDMAPENATPDRLEPLEDAWIRAELLSAILSTSPIDDLFGTAPAGTPRWWTIEDLWNHEPRIGLQVDRKTRMAEEGRLYSALHVRPHRELHIGLAVTGIPDDWQSPEGRVAPFGGEGRAALWREWPGATSEWQPKPTIEQRIRQTGRFTIVALTPTDLPAPVISGTATVEWPTSCTTRVVAACTDRPQRIGGWDRRKGPRALRNYLPAGSVLFCETDNPEGVADYFARTDHPRVGSRTAAGFGLVAIGQWDPIVDKESGI